MLCQAIAERPISKHIKFKRLYTRYQYCFVKHLCLFYSVVNNFVCNVANPQDFTFGSNGIHKGPSRVEKADVMVLDKHMFEELEVITRSIKK